GARLRSLRPRAWLTAPVGAGDSTQPRAPSRSSLAAPPQTAGLSNSPAAASANAAAVCRAHSLPLLAIISWSRSTSRGSRRSCGSPKKRTSRRAIRTRDISFDHLVGEQLGQAMFASRQLGRGGDKVISPPPVALIEGRRRGQWCLPGTTDSLCAREAKVLHQVNQVVAQSEIRWHPVDRFYARHFDLRQGGCRRFVRPDRRRLLRM